MAANQRLCDPLEADSSSRISVIIPTRNEALTLARTLTAVRAASQTEIIVVDGDSQDETVAIAQSFQTKVISMAPGRAGQMNRGCQLAQGDILLFLHADTRLPAAWDQWVRHTLAQPGVVAGAFDLNIDGAGRGLRLVEWGVKMRSRQLQLPYGDQAIFLHRKVFQALGGFPDLPIMEDFELVRQLRRQGNIAIAPAAVLTSSRRWQTLGVWRATLMNQFIIAGYFLGIDPQQLVRWYRHWGKRP